MNITDNRKLMLNLTYSVVLIVNLFFDFCFGGQIKTFRLLTAIVAIWIVYFVYIKSFLRKTTIMYYIMFVFIFAATYLGSVQDFYILIPYYDKILHSISGIIIAILGYLIFLSLNNGKNSGDFNKYFGIIFSVVFSIAAAGVWEIWEFASDIIFGLASQNNSLFDTMMDIICGSAMGIIANIPMYFYIKGKKIKYIDKIIEEINK